MVTHSELLHFISKVMFESEVNQDLDQVHKQHSSLYYSKIYETLTARTGKTISNRDLSSDYQNW
jgi:hypothetical protein